MRPAIILVTTLCAALPLVAAAQNTTNAPATEIENFELQTDAVIVKGVGQIGTVATEAGPIVVRCKESTNVTTGQKRFAMAIGIEANQSRMVLLVDYDELDALLHGLDFLGKVTYSVTTMPAFNATITTRSGFRAGAHSEQRQSSIELFVQFADTDRVPVTPDQFTQLQNLIIQAKSALDTAKSKNQGG